jgi:MYXO-CTERM domain-containing protein
MARITITAAAFALTFTGAPRSEAHFILNAPPSWMSQTSAGLPEKLGPCGDEDDGTANATPSNIVTAHQEGDTITVTIDEVIFHPGHYRIALGAPDRSALPPEPLVDAGSGTPCGTAVIESPPVYPVLADNVFPHSSPFSTPQTTMVKLPPGVTCTKCTLQVLEFMSQHPLNVPGGCFYHHCADISISASSDGGSTPDAGGSGDGGIPDASTGAENEPTQSGCGCSVPTTGSPLAAGALALALGLLARYRRRSSG